MSVELGLIVSKTVYPDVLPEADQKRIINKLDKWIQMRVEGMIQNNRWNYYGECAALLQR